MKSKSKLPVVSDIIPYAKINQCPTEMEIESYIKETKALV